MTTKEKLFLKLIESLMTVVSIVAVVLDFDGKLRTEEARTINRAFNAYSAAHYDLLHVKEEKNEARLHE